MKIDRIGQFLLFKISTSFKTRGYGTWKYYRQMNNSSNYDLQWHNSFPIDFNAFSFCLKLPPVSKHLFISRVRWTCKPSSIWRCTNHLLADVLLFPKIYTLIAFYQRIIELRCHTMYFSDAPRINWMKFFCFVFSIKQKHLVSCILLPLDPSKCFLVK